MDGYPCPICFRLFTRQTHRKRHYDTMHSEIKRHECSVCQRQFARKDYLTKHFVAHHPEQYAEFACGKCPRKCLSQAELDGHTVTYHPPEGETMILSSMDVMDELAFTLEAGGENLGDIVAENFLDIKQEILD